MVGEAVMIRPRGPKSRHWFLTIINPTPQDRYLINSTKNAFTYFVLGDEVTPNGRAFIQGYAVFKQRKHRAGARKIFPRAYLVIKSPSNTYAAAIAYCKKRGLFVEYGVAPLNISTRRRLERKRRSEVAIDALLALKRAKKANEIIEQVQRFELKTRTQQLNPLEEVDPVTYIRCLYFDKYMIDKNK